MSNGPKTAPALPLFNMLPEYKAALEALLGGFSGLSRLAKATLLSWSLCVASSAAQEESIHDLELDAASEAQGAADRDEESIQDPELSSASPSSSAGSGEADEIIADPELADLRTEAAEMGDLPTELRALLHSRISRDLFRAELSEEVWKVQHLIQLESKLRPDERTRIALGTRLRYGLYATEFDEPDSGSLRYLLDVQPLETYYDRTLAPGAHLRLGYQDVSLGRFDALSGTDVLSIADLRDGPATLPDAVRPSQLALRIDLVPSASLGLELCWVPFFTPHLVQVADGDFAAFPRNRSAVDSALLAAFSTLEDTSALDRAVALSNVQLNLRNYLSRSARSQSARAGLDLFAPDPNFAASQFAARARVHGQVGELALTLATALEKIPSYRLSKAVISALRQSIVDVEGGGSDSLGLGKLAPIFSQLQIVSQSRTTAASIAGEFEDPAIRLDYGRFYVGSLDGALDVGPVQLGMEVSIGVNRVMPVEGPLWDMFSLVEYERALMGGGGVRAEYVGGETWLFLVEATFGMALSRPKAPSATGYLGLLDGRYQLAAVGLLAWSPGPFRVEVGTAISSDLSYFIMPRLALDLGKGMELELGVQALGYLPSNILGGSNLVIGARYDSLDQMYLGFRWVPLF